MAEIFGRVSCDMMYLENVLRNSIEKPILWNDLLDDALKTGNENYLKEMFGEYHVDKRKKFLQIED